MEFIETDLREKDRVALLLRRYEFLSLQAELNGFLSMVLAINIKRPKNSKHPLEVLNNILFTIMDNKELNFEDGSRILEEEVVIFDLLLLKKTFRELSIIKRSLTDVLKEKNSKGFGCNQSFKHNYSKCSAFLDMIAELEDENYKLRVIDAKDLKEMHLNV